MNITLESLAREGLKPLELIASKIAIINLHQRDRPDLGSTNSEVVYSTGVVSVQGKPSLLYSNVILADKGSLYNLKFVGLDLLYRCDLMDIPNRKTKSNIPDAKKAFVSDMSSVKEIGEISYLHGKMEVSQVAYIFGKQGGKLVYSSIMDGEDGNLSEPQMIFLDKIIGYRQVKGGTF